MTDKTPNRICKNCGQPKTKHGYWDEYLNDFVYYYDSPCSKFEPQDNSPQTKSYAKGRRHSNTKEDTLRFLPLKDKTADIPLSEKELSSQDGSVSFDDLHEGIFKKENVALAIQRLKEKICFDRDSKNKVNICNTQETKDKGNICYNCAVVDLIFGDFKSEGDD